jgi:hypothetical protein
MLGVENEGKMFHTFEIDIMNGILRESFIGLIDLDVLRDVNTAIILNPEFRKGLNFLTDLREAKIKMDYEEMLIHTSQLPDLGIKKQAFIVDRDLEFGMVRMFETLSEEKGLYGEVRIFKEIEEGLKWLSS